MKPQLTPDELAKVRECLDILQQAQNDVETAAQRLCSVPGFAKEWQSLGKPYDAIKAAWHRVEIRRVGLQRQARGGVA